MTSSLTAYDTSLSMIASSDPPKLVAFDEIQKILANLLSTKQGVDSILQSQLEAFRISSKSGQCANLPIQTAGQKPYPALTAGPGAQVCIKTGYVINDTVMVSKCAGGGGEFGGNTGSVSVYDQKTLRLKAVLCDEGLLTEIRTAAAAVVATRAAILGSGAKVQKLGIVGGGVQALWHLRLLAASEVIDTKSIVVIVKTRSPASAQKFIQTMKASPYEPDRQFTIQVYDENGDRFKGCQVIHTVTPSRAPVLDVSDVDLPKDSANAFLHISAIGSDSPGKCELSEELILEVNSLWVDSELQARERGEFQPAREKVTSLPIKEIGALGVLDPQSGMLADSKPGIFSIFDASGMAIQDVQMAKLVSQSL